MSRLTALVIVALTMTQRAGRALLRTADRMALTCSQRRETHAAGAVQLDGSCTSCIPAAIGTTGAPLGQTRGRTWYLPRPTPPPPRLRSTRATSLQPWSRKGAAVAELAQGGKQRHHPHVSLVYVRLVRTARNKAEQVCGSNYCQACPLAAPAAPASACPLWLTLQTIPNPPACCMTRWGVPTSRCNGLSDSRLSTRRSYPHPPACCMTRWGVPTSKPSGPSQTARIAPDTTSPQQPSPACCMMRCGVPTSRSSGRSSCSRWLPMSPPPLTRADRNLAVCARTFATRRICNRAMCRGATTTREVQTQAPGRILPAATKHACSNAVCATGTVCFTSGKSRLPDRSAREWAPAPAPAAAWVWRALIPAAAPLPLAVALWFWCGAEGGGVPGCNAQGQARAGEYAGQRRTRMSRVYQTGQAASGCVCCTWSCAMLMPAHHQTVVDTSQQQLPHHQSAQLSCSPTGSR